MPPWRTSVEWRTVNAAFAFHIERYGDILETAASISHRLRYHLTSISGFMDDLCAKTCIYCPTPCCIVAKVWYDFNDLLYLHLNGLEIPTAQPILNYHQICRYYTPRGCRIPRIRRPYMCTRYLCPTQTARMRKMTSARKGSLETLLAAIKTDRQSMENEFIRIVSDRNSAA